MNDQFVYVAGPYRGKDAMAHDYSVYHNIQHHITEAHRWATMLVNDGIYYFCPHLNSYHMEVVAPNVDPQFWYYLDFAILAHAWAILLIPGWRDSSGSKAEKAFALERKIRVYTHNQYEQLKEDWGAIHQPTS